METKPKRTLHPRTLALAAALALPLLLVGLFQLWKDDPALMEGWVFGWMAPWNRPWAGCTLRSPSRWGSFCWPCCWGAAWSG